MNSEMRFLILLILVGSGLGLSVYSIVTRPKIAYVRSVELLDKYIGVKEARKLIEEKNRQWQMNIDTLKSDFEQSVKTYQEESNKLTRKEQSKLEEELSRQQESIRNYIGAVENKSVEEENKIMQGALNQINEYIERYSKEQGYDLVVGVTQSGNILYGDEGIDITEEILEGLNKSYKK